MWWWVDLPAGGCVSVVFHVCASSASAPWCCRSWRPGPWPAPSVAWIGAAGAAAVCRPACRRRLRPDPPAWSSRWRAGQGSGLCGVSPRATRSRRDLSPGRVRHFGASSGAGVVEKGGHERRHRITASPPAPWVCGIESRMAPARSDPYPCLSAAGRVVSSGAARRARRPSRCRLPERTLQDATNREVSGVTPCQQRRQTLRTLRTSALVGSGVLVVTA